MISRAVGKRIICILLYRIYNEQPLVEKWINPTIGLPGLHQGSPRPRFAGLRARYSRPRAPQVPLPYPVFDDYDSEDLYKKLVHLALTIQTYKGDIVAIRHALDTLGPDNFVEFAEAPTSRPVSPSAP